MPEERLDEQQPEKPSEARTDEAKVEDLDLPEDQGEAVSGGMELHKLQLDIQ